MGSPCLAIVAGAGELPINIVKHCIKNNLNYKIIHFEGVELPWAKGQSVISAKFEKPNTLFLSLKDFKCDQVVFAGSMKRPKLNPLRFDKKFLSIASRLLPALKSGDDTTLKIIAEIFEKEGFKIISANQLLKNLFVSEGILTKLKPNDDDLIDIKRGLEILDHISAIDVGQACIVGQGLCLGIETIQGSDELIKFASLKKDAYLNNKAGGKGVFLKSQKINQDTRIDVPTIGINTIQNIANAGFSGIALKANNVQIIDKEVCIELANQLGIFIVSVSNKQS